MPKCLAVYHEKVSGEASHHNEADQSRRIQRQKEINRIESHVFLSGRRLSPNLGVP